MSNSAEDVKGPYAKHRIPALIALLLLVPLPFLILSAGPGLGDNLPPIADAGEDITKVPGFDQVLLNDVVTLNGSASQDEDIGSCSWSWACVSHTGIILQGAATPTPSFVVTVEGTIQFRLVLTDPEGLSDSDDVRVIVSTNSAPNAVMLSPAPSPPPYFRSQRVQFSANTSSDPEGRPLSFKWTDNVSGQLSTERSFARQLTTLGHHRITLEVSDPNGGSSSTWADIVVREDPATPKAAFEVLPRRTDATYKKSEVIRLDASMTTDPNTGEVLEYIWRTDIAGGRLLGTGQLLNVTLEEGSHNITLKVTDSDGLSDEAWAIIEVKNTPPTARISVPEVRSRGGKPTVNVSEVVRFVGTSSSDLDGDELIFSWDFGDGTTSVGEEVLHTFLQWGTSLVTLTVDDGSILDSSSTAELLLSINTVPVAAIEGPGYVTMGEAFTLTANGSADEDGDALSYLWDLDGDGLTDTQGFSVVHLYSEEGVHKVVLTVSDGFATSRSELLVEAVYPNEVPVAKVLGYDSTKGGTVVVVLEDNRGTITLDASPSYDPDDDVNGNGVIDGRERSNLTFFWDLDADRDQDGDGVPNNDLERSGKTLRLTIVGTSTKRVVLFARDKRGATGDLLIALRGDHMPRITDIRTDPSSTILVNGSVRFTVSATDDDRSDIRLLKYDLDFGDGQVVKASLVNEMSHTYLVPGTYDVKANVTDGSLYSTYVRTIKVVKLSPPEVRYPQRDAKVSGTVLVKGTMTAPTGWTVKLVEVSVDGKAWAEADGTNSWEYSLPTSRLSKGKHTLTVRGTVKAGTSEVISETTTSFIVAPPAEKGSSPIPIIIGMIVVIVVLACLYLFVIRRRRGKGQMEELFAPPPVEGISPPSMQPQFRPSAPPAAVPPVIGAPAGTGVLPPTPPQAKGAPPPPEVRKVKVKCPACGKLFMEQDTGERPLHTACRHCGAKGSIESLPWDKPSPETEPQERPSEGPEPVPIICPSCGEVFELKGPMTEAKCPACGAVGELDEETQKKLKEAYDRVKELTIRCPKCSQTFHVKQGVYDVICPFCGTKGKLPK